MGGFFALGAPIGWFVLAHYVPDTSYRSYLYLYQTLGTLIAFSFFGFFLGSSQDILHKIIDADHLTNLLNQKSFKRRVRDVHNLGVRYKDQMVIMMMDIDRFKKVNDDHNHLVGSKILQDIAEIIRRNLRETDIAARFGGDEFIVCLPRTELPSGVEAAERIRKEIESTTFEYKEHRIQVTSSIGLFGGLCLKGQSIDDFIEKADLALYRAKDSGRNQVCSEDAKLPQAL